MTLDTRSLCMVHNEGKLLIGVIQVYHPLHVDMVMAIIQQTFKSLGQKVTLVAWLLLLSIDILAKGGLYSNKILLIKSKRDI